MFPFVRSFFFALKWQEARPGMLTVYYCTIRLNSENQGFLYQLLYPEINEDSYIPIRRVTVCTKGIGYVTFFGRRRNYANA